MPLILAALRYLLPGLFQGQAIDIRRLGLIAVAPQKRRESGERTALSGFRVLFVLIHRFKSKTADAIVKHDST